MLLPVRRVEGAAAVGTDELLDAEQEFAVSCLTLSPSEGGHEASAQRWQAGLEAWERRKRGLAVLGMGERSSRARDHTLR